MAVNRYTLIPGVAVVLVRDEKFLLLRRSPSSSFGPGQLCLPGGHVDADETVTAAAMREVKEEIGLEISHKDMEFVHLLHRRGGTPCDYLLSYFLVRSWHGDPFNVEPEKHSELVWAPLYDVPHDMLVGQRYALTQWIMGKSYSEFGW